MILFGLLAAALLPSGALAATPAGTVEIDPEVQDIRVTDWGYDIKNASVISGLSASKARNLFVTDRMSVLRIAVWGDDPRPAHPGPGEVDTTYYVHDGTGGSLKMFTAMKNVRDARPDVIFFASKKLDGQTSFPPWTKDADGVIPEQYARMLADYLRFMEHDTTRKSESFVIPILGVDNEIEYNEGNITPERHLAIVTNLLALSQETGTVDLVDTTHATHTTVTVPASFTMPLIIGPERYGPTRTWVTNLLDLPGGDATLDMVGTHYYPRWRPYNNLANMMGDGNGRNGWHSEVHWTNQAGKDDLGDAEAALAAIFDCIDIGLSGFSWWAYTRTGFKGEMEQAITTSTIQGRQVAMDDEDGYNSPDVEGSLITRAFRQGRTVHVWALNDTETTYVDHQFTLLRGELSGDVTFSRWLEQAGSFVSISGVSTAMNDQTFSSTLPPNSITRFTFPYRSPGPAAVHPLDGDTLDTSGNGNHGTPFGGYVYAEGRDDQGLEFNGVDAYVSVPRTVSDEFTIAFWMRTDTPGHESGTTPQWWQGSGLVDGEVGGAAGDFGVTLRGTNVAFGVGQPDTTIFSSTGMADGQWRHVAVTRNSVTGEMGLFVNGKSDAYTTGPTGSKTSPPALHLGSLQTGINYFSGQLDEVRIYDRVLEPGEIQDLAFFDTTVLITETWEDATSGGWSGTGSAQADHLWTYQAPDRIDWGIINARAPLRSKALGVARLGSNSSSADAETPLPRTIDPLAFEWVTLDARFVLNGLTTSGSADTRVYAVDRGRQNGYGILARSEVDASAPILLRVLSDGSSTTVPVGAADSPEDDVIYEVAASFKRISDTFTLVRYRVLKDGADWQAGDVVIGRAPTAGALLEKLECSQQKNAFSYIDDVSVSIQPDLRDLHIGSFEVQSPQSNSVLVVGVPTLDVPYHIETATNGMAFAAEPGTTFEPDVSPWRAKLLSDPAAGDTLFYRVREGARED